MGTRPGGAHHLGSIPPGEGPWGTPPMQPGPGREGHPQVRLLQGGASSGPGPGRFRFLAAQFSGTQRCSGAPAAHRTVRPSPALAEVPTVGDLVGGGPLLPHLLPSSCSSPQSPARGSLASAVLTVRGVTRGFGWRCRGERLPVYLRPPGCLQVSSAHLHGVCVCECVHTRVWLLSPTSVVYFLDAIVYDWPDV